MRRREFLAGVGGAAAWPVTARAQQDRMRRIVMFSGTSDNPIIRARHAAFRDELQNFGWVERRNVRFDMRWGGGEDAGLDDPNV